MLFLAEHHAIRLIAAEPCAHLESVAYLLNILEIMPCEKVWGRSACLQRIRRDKRLEKRFSGRLVLERSRSNGGLFSCCMLDGWKTMKQREAGDAYFFLAGGGTACLSPIQPCNFSHIENASFCEV